MKNLLKYAVATAVMFAPLMNDAQAQIQVNNGITLQASLNTNVYPGFVVNGSYTVTFANNFQGTPSLMAGKFRIRVILPIGINFPAAYVPPTGWSYTLLNNNECALTPTVDVTNTFGLNTTNFVIPITTQTGVSNDGFTAYLQPLGPPVNGYQFSNYTIPSGTVTVINNPLPVLFQDFTATTEGCKVTLNWSTAVEKNNSHFVIERSSNSSEFTSIGRTNGAGTSFELNSYTYVDEKPLANHNFYRIRQVDFDGSTTTSTIANTKVDCQSSGISIYPNPATNVVNVKGLTNKAVIEVYNVVGQKVVTKNAENALEAVNLSGLADGVYQVQVVSGGETIFSSKLIKK